jgi:hypothetical protein
MKYFGDIPKKHKDLLEELQLLERLIYKHKNTISVLEFSKHYVCLAHDYYMLSMEEEGDRLILLAEDASPGYFIAPILSHAKRDKYFGIIVEQLQLTLALDLMKSLGFENEQ